jgi:hypothetical protein
MGFALPGAKQSGVYGMATHNYLLPIIAQTIPLLDIFCCRFLIFLFKCLSHDSELVSSIANFAVRYGRASSPIGQNLLFCTKLYRISPDDILRNDPRRCVLNSCRMRLSEEEVAQANHLREILLLRDNELTFSADNSFLTCSDLNIMISHVCLN